MTRGHETFPGNGVRVPSAGEDAVAAGDFQFREEVSGDRRIGAVDLEIFFRETGGGIVARDDHRGDVARIFQGDDVVHVAASGRADRERETAGEVVKQLEDVSHLVDDGRFAFLDYGPVMAFRPEPCLADDPVEDGGVARGAVLEEEFFGVDHHRGKLPVEPDEKRLLEIAHQVQGLHGLVLAPAERFFHEQGLAVFFRQLHDIHARIGFGPADDALDFRVGKNLFHIRGDLFDPVLLESVRFQVAQGFQFHGGIGQQVRDVIPAAEAAAADDADPGFIAHRYSPCVKNQAGHPAGNNISPPCPVCKQKKRTDPCESVRLFSGSDSLNGQITSCRPFRPCRPFRLPASERVFPFPGFR